MALTPTTELEAAVASVFAAIVDAKFRDSTAHSTMELFEEILPRLHRYYRGDLTVTITDSTDASVAAAIAVTGELGLAWAAANQFALTFPVGYTFVVTGTGDFVDNALATAKGSAVAAGDIFQITSGTTVAYVGAAAPDFSSVERADF